MFLAQQELEYRGHGAFSPAYGCFMEQVAPSQASLQGQSRHGQMEDTREVAPRPDSSPIPHCRVSWVPNQATSECV